MTIKRCLVELEELDSIAVCSECAEHAEVFLSLGREGVYLCRRHAVQLMKELKNATHSNFDPGAKEVF